MTSLILGALKSWKTSLLGGIPGALIMLQQIQYATDSDPSTTFSLMTFISALSMALAFLVAKDSTVTGKV